MQLEINAGRYDDRLPAEVGGSSVVPTGSSANLAGSDGSLSALFEVWEEQIRKWINGKATNAEICRRLGVCTGYQPHRETLRRWLVERGLRKTRIASEVSLADWQIKTRAWAPIDPALIGPPELTTLADAAFWRARYAPKARNLAELNEARRALGLVEWRIRKAPVT